MAQAVVTQTNLFHSASFAGTRVVLRQVSPESEHIYDFIIALHKHSSGDYAALAKEAGLSSEEIGAYLNYAAQFLGNLGNYKSFGDSKFVPRLDARQLRGRASASLGSRPCIQTDGAQPASNGSRRLPLPRRRREALVRLGATLTAVLSNPSFLSATAAFTALYPLWHLA